nr:hypothetical protein [Bacteroidales bacterium]
PTNKTKYYLWLECERRDPYEGKPISLAQLFTPDIEIEHIIPYSISGDDSFANKTLSFKSFNAKKGNKTPMQYFSDKSDEFKRFKQNIKNFPDNKKDRFLLTDEKIESFRNSQLNSTSYIGTEVRKHLLKSFKNEDVVLTNGTMTSLIRTLLGFNGVLNKPVKVEECFKNMGKVWAIIGKNNTIMDFVHRDGDNEPKNTNTIKGVINHSTFYPSKVRNDHRHHTVDALVTALVNSRINNAILKLTEGTVDVDTGEFTPKFFTNEKGEHRLTRDTIEGIKGKLKKELNLLDMDELLPIAKDKIKHILVSYQNKKLKSSPRKKLFLSNGQPLKDSSGKHKRSGGISVRNELHEANFYGKTNDCKEDEVVKRVKVASLSTKQLVNIVDKTIRDTIIKSVAEKILDLIDDPEKLIQLKDENLKNIESIKDFFYQQIQLEEIKEQIEELKGDKGKEATIVRNSLRNKQQIL